MDNSCIIDSESSFILFLNNSQKQYIFFYQILLIHHRCSSLSKDISDKISRINIHCEEYIHKWEIEESESSINRCRNVVHRIEECCDVYKEYNSRFSGQLCHLTDQLLFKTKDNLKWNFSKKLYEQEIQDIHSYLYILNEISSQLIKIMDILITINLLCFKKHENSDIYSNEEKNKLLSFIELLNNSDKETISKPLSQSTVDIIPYSFLPSPMVSPSIYPSTPFVTNNNTINNIINDKNIIIINDTNNINNNKNDNNNDNDNNDNNKILSSQQTSRKRVLSYDNSISKQKESNNDNNNNIKEEEEEEEKDISRIYHEGIKRVNLSNEHYNRKRRVLFQDIHDYISIQTDKKNINNKYIYSFSIYNHACSELFLKHYTYICPYCSLNHIINIQKQSYMNKYVDITFIPSCLPQVNITSSKTLLLPLLPLVRFPLVQSILSQSIQHFNSKSSNNSSEISDIEGNLFYNTKLSDNTENNLNSTDSSISISI
ncbi:hypothetical protein WA158_007587 [Blastocystis sp. Blastoise]